MALDEFGRERMRCCIFHVGMRDGHGLRRRKGGGMRCVYRNEALFAHRGGCGGQVLLALIVLEYRALVQRRRR